MKDNISQHKRMAMGESVPQRLARGGRVAPVKSGVPTTPITDAKRSNGIPGMKKGGRC